MKENNPPLICHKSILNIEVTYKLFSSLSHSDFSIFRVFFFDTTYTYEHSIYRVFISKFTTQNKFESKIDTISY